MAEEKPDFKHPQPQSSQPAYGQVFSDSPDPTLQVQDEDELKRRVSFLESKRTNLNTDILGLFETVTVAPTGTPFNIFQQIKLATISGTTYLYIYDTKAHAWLRVALA